MRPIISQIPSANAGGEAVLTHALLAEPDRRRVDDHRNLELGRELEGRHGLLRVPIVSCGLDMVQAPLRLSFFTGALELAQERVAAPGAIDAMPTMQGCFACCSALNLFCRSPTDFVKLIAEETTKWSKVVKFISVRSHDISRFLRQPLPPSACHQPLRLAPPIEGCLDSIVVGGGVAHWSLRPAMTGSTLENCHPRTVRCVTSVSIVFLIFLPRRAIM
jgi:hypothetical protein